MTTTHASAAAAPAEESTATPTLNQAKPARWDVRWTWIGPHHMVAALGAADTSIAATSVGVAQAKFADVNERYAHLETREGIAQRSPQLIRDHPDRLGPRIEAMQATRG